MGALYLTLNRDDGLDLIEGYDDGYDRLYLLYWEVI